jgi:uncharacterized membrane protein
MPKIKKEESMQKQKESIEQKLDRTQLKQNMFISAIITFLISGIFLLFTMLFAFEVLEIENPDDSTGLKVLDVLLKGGLVILFFFFMFVSVGNMQELRGYIMTWKEMVIIIALALFPATTDGWVFLTSAIGVILIIIYFYLIQIKTKE